MKWFRRIGLGALSLSLALAAVLDVYVYRASPVLEGEFAVSSLAQPVHLSRDEADVTRIESPSAHYAWFALGFLHAQELGWQLEFNRGVMSGQFVDPRDKLGPKKYLHSSHDLDEAPSVQRANQSSNLMPFGLDGSHRDMASLSYHIVSTTS